MGEPALRPHQIYIRTAETACSQRGALDEPQLPCRDWVEIEARYEDAWRTPMAGAEFRLYVNDAVVIERGTLRDYAPPLTRGKPPLTPDEKAAYARLGTFMHRNTDRGRARAEILADPEAEEDLADLVEGLRMRLDGPYRALRQAMEPFRTEWEKSGWWSLKTSADAGSYESAKEWAEGLGDLVTAQYWREMGEGFDRGLSRTLDAAAAAGEKAAKIAEDIYDNADKVLDGAWWRRTAEKAAGRVRETADEAWQAACDAAATLEKGTDYATKLVRHRAAILSLPALIAAGKVDELEAFVDSVVRDFDPAAADALRYDPAWQATIELLHEGEAAALVVVYLDLFVSAVPPTFWAYAYGRASFCVAVEALMLIAGALLGGAGAAARIGVISARIARLATSLPKFAKMADKALDAIRAIVRMVDAFADAITDIDKIKAKLLKARRRSVSKSGTRSTLRHRRETEDRDGRCRICGGKDHHTPIRPPGEVDYV